MFRKAGQFVRRAQTSSAAETVSDLETTSDPETASDPETEDADDDDDADFDDDADSPEIHRSVDPLQITRRDTLYGHVRCQRKRHVRTGGVPRGVADLQTLWLEYASHAAALFPPSMWRVLHAVRNESKTTQSAVLKACQKMLPKKQQKLWPSCRQAVDTKICKSLGPFHPRVMREVLHSTAYAPQHTLHSISSTAYHPQCVIHSIRSTACTPQHILHIMYSTA